MHPTHRTPPAPWWALAALFVATNCDTLDVRPGYLVTATVPDFTLWTDEARILDMREYFAAPDGGEISYEMTATGDAVEVDRPTDWWFRIQPRAEGRARVHVRAEAGGVGDTTSFAVVVRDLCAEGGLGSDSLFPFEEHAEWVFTETRRQTQLGIGSTTETGTITWTFGSFDCATASGAIQQRRQGIRRGGGTTSPPFEEEYDVSGSMTLVVGPETLELSMLESDMSIRRETVVDGPTSVSLTGFFSVMREDIQLRPGVGVRAIDRVVVPTVLGACCFTQELRRVGSSQ